MSNRTNLFLDYVEYKARIQKRQHIVRSIYASERVVEAVRPLTYAEYHNLALLPPDRIAHQVALDLVARSEYDALNRFEMNRGQKG